MSKTLKIGSAAKIKIDSFDDLFGNDTTQNSSLEQIISVPLADLHTCEWHNKNTHFWRRKFPTLLCLIFE